MQLFIGNKNYSSWSMRPWVLMKQTGIEFEEIMLRFDSFSPDSDFKQALSKFTPAGRVPVLVVDDGLAIWDSLAIAEYLAEKFPAKPLWPRDPRQRARARSVCAEMHAGFTHLRSHFGMNIEARLPEVGSRVLRENTAVRSDVERITQLWTGLLSEHGGPMLFGEFGIADAFFAPVAMRFRTFALPMPEPIGGYIDRLAALPGVAAWIEGALAERDFLAFEEPYRRRR